MIFQDLDPRTIIQGALRYPFFLVLLLAAAACTQPAQETDLLASTSPPQRTVEAPTGTLPDGSEITLELAITPEELATGLMYRPTLAADRGMLLLFEIERSPSIWMKNTLINLDLIYLDNSGAIVHLVADVPPCATDPCPTYSSENEARAVLEMITGSIETHGLSIGDTLAFERVPGYPLIEAAAETEADTVEEN